MNTPAMISRLDQRALPQWNAGSPGYVALRSAENRQGSRLAGVVRKYWWLALLIWAVLAVPAMVVIYRYVPPQYVATAAINVAPVTVNPLSDTEKTTAFYNEYLRTQAELIKNPYVMQRASEDIRLSRYDWFRNLSDQVGYLTEHMIVEAVPATQNIRIQMIHQDAQAAKAIVDSVVDAYFAIRNELEEKNTDKSLEILRRLQSQTDKDLAKAQSDLSKLTAEGDVNTTMEDRKVLSEVLANAQQTENKLVGEQLALDAQIANLKGRKVPERETYVASIPTDGDPQIDQWMKTRITILTNDSVLASRHATTEHPDRQEYRKQLKVLDQKVADRRKEIQDHAWNFYSASFELDRAKKLNDAQADVEALKQQIANLRTRITEQQGLARTLGTKAQPILTLKEQIADYKAGLKRYNDRIEEIENQNRAPGRVASVAPTVLPKTPTVDRRVGYALASNGLGLFLGLVVLVFIMKLRDRIDHAEDLPNGFQPLVVGTVSNVGGGGAVVRGLNGQVRRKILGEEMRLLHANLLPPGPTQRRIMMVTSPTPANGKTSIASQLALSLAKSGLNVLLIDADLRKRDLSTLFDVGFRPGLADLLQGNAPELIQPVELLPNLKVMGAGMKLERNPVELLQRRHFHENLNLLQEKFDCVVVDTPPALVVADARLIARSCDEVLCVVRAQVTSPKEIHQTIDALSRITGKTPKIIMNGVDQRQSYYKYKNAYTESQEESPVAAGGVIAGRDHP